MNNFYIEIIDKYGDIIHRISNIPTEEEVADKMEMLADRNYCANAYNNKILIQSIGNQEITISYFSNDFIKCPFGENIFENSLDIY